MTHPHSTRQRALIRRKNLPAKASTTAKVRAFGQQGRKKRALPTAQSTVKRRVRPTPRLGRRGLGVPGKTLLRRRRGIRI